MPTAAESPEATDPRSAQPPLPPGDPTDREPIYLSRVLVEEFNAQFPAAPIDYAALKKQVAEESDASKEVDAADEVASSRRESVLVGKVYAEVRKRQAEATRIERTALCFSGGGIRSATFGLGIVQGLAGLGLLKRFDYLSTVSGGGYLGSWLSGWIQRTPGGVEAVEKALAEAPPSPLLPEPAPIQHLRQFSRYMSPRVGLLSADTWTLVAIFSRNLLLNWLVLVPLLALVLMVPRVGAFLIRMTPSAAVESGVFWFGLFAGVVAITYIAANRPSLIAAYTGKASPRRAWYRSQNGFLWFCLLPLALMSISSTLFWSWKTGVSGWVETVELFGRPVETLYAFLAFGILLHLGGFLVSLAYRPGLRRFQELGAVVFTGGLGGAAAYVAAHAAATHFLSTLPLEIARLVYVCVAAPLLLLLFLLAATLFVGLASRRTSDEDREWLARAGAWIMIWVSGRLFLSALVFFGPLLWLQADQRLMAAVGGASGLVTLLLGFGSHSGSPQKKEGEPSLGSKVSNVALSLAAPLFALTILVAISALTSLLIRALASDDTVWPDLTYAYQGGLVEVVAGAPGVTLAWVALGLLVVGALFGSFVDINRFSLHSAYRDRLIRAYLGASVERGARHPDPFTGFDENDNLPLHALTSRRPFHLVNTALNLVHGQNLALQDRKAESFTFSPLHCGYRGGYRPSSEYGRHGQKENAPRLSLGTAVAISGAAASPNMGYHSSPVITFLLALFNVRLGWWLGNSGPAGKDTYDSPGPRFSPKALFNEAFGLTDDQRRYVYLTDGGHFENLGLYEMVLRRCRYIVVADGGADGDFTFEDLGGALSKIRIDFGIPIEFGDGLKMRARPDLRELDYPPPTKEGLFPYYALAKIRYSAADLPCDASEEKQAEVDGWLLYLKLSINGTEPADVYHYARLHPTFPHESTGNQLYSEQQFESYRMLGKNVVHSLVEAIKAREGAAGIEEEKEAKEEPVDRAAIRDVKDLFAKLGPV